MAIVVPALDAAATLRACLDGIAGAGLSMRQVTVVDDGSRDGTARIAAGRGARVVATSGRAGAAAARNLGAASSVGDPILFVDADVVLAPDAAARIAAAFADDPRLDALYGSYDDAPPAPGTVSRVRNLLHHHVHQKGGGRSASFWTGIGAVRRAAFEAVGGFEPDQRMMEDVRFGHDLWRAGGRILLRPDVQGAHLKRWSLGSMLRADLLDRALPWSRLILDPSRPRPPAELNVSATGKLSVAMAGVGAMAAGGLIPALALGAGIGATALAGACALAVIALANRDFLALASRRLGRSRLPAALAVLWAHYTAAGLGFALALAERFLRSR